MRRSTRASCSARERGIQDLIDARAACSESIAADAVPALRRAAPRPLRRGPLRAGGEEAAARDPAARPRFRVAQADPVKRGGPGRGGPAAREGGKEKPRQSEDAWSPVSESHHARQTLPLLR